MNVSCIKGQTTVQTCLWKGNCPPHPHTTDEWTVINLSFLGKPNSVWLATPSPEQTKSRCVNAPKTCRGSSAVWLNWTARSLTPMETWTKSTWSTAAASVARFKKLFTQIRAAAKAGLVLCCWVTRRLLEASSSQQTYKKVSQSWAAPLEERSWKHSQWNSLLWPFQVYEVEDDHDSAQVKTGKSIKRIWASSDSNGMRSKLKKHFTKSLLFFTDLFF